MNRNIQFNYLYRDAGNYKQWGSVVFSNNDEYQRSISSFIREVENRMAAGWNVFDPAEPYLPRPDWTGTG